MVFFYVPFALLFVLLVRIDWNRQLIDRAACRSWSGWRLCSR